MNQDQITELARARAKEILTGNQIFLNRPIAEQERMYQEVVKDQEEKIANEQGFSAGQGLAESFKSRNQRRKPRPRPVSEDSASRLIDDSRHDKDFEDGVDAFEDLVESVDFPKFVGDLLGAVFQANITVMKEQTDAYIKLMKEASTGLASFIKKIDDTTTFAYLAENQGEEFGIEMEEDADGNEKLSLTNPQGEKVDVEDNEVKAKIMDAKIKMAQEHRAALREMILMGVTRLVVEKGEIEAEVNFEFKADRDLEKKDRAIKKKAESSGRSFKAGGGGGIIGFLGGPDASYGSSSSTRKTQLSVSSTKSKSTDELKAKLRGYVNIKFKTDYFKLDNFSQMYAPASQEEQQAALGPPGGAK